MAFNNIRTVNVPSIGKLPLSDKPGTFTPAGEVRTPKSGRLPSDSGFTTAHTQAMLEVNLNLAPGLDIDALNSVVDEDITVRLEDGTVYLMSRAYRTDKPAGIGDGETKVTFAIATSDRLS